MAPLAARRDSIVFTVAGDQSRWVSSRSETSAAIDRDAYVGRESRRFVEKLLGGRLSPMVAYLAEADALDEKDIAEIEALLKELKS